MLKKLFISLFACLALQACLKPDVNIPVTDYSPDIKLRPQQGLVDEPVFGGEVYIDLKGNPSGPVIVLIHGLGDNASRIWDQTIQKLETDYFLVTLDLPGFGRSSKTNVLYSPENYVRLIHHIQQTYIGQPFHLVGHSMGGAISLRYGATHPNDIKTLTLIDAAGILHRLAYTQYLAPLGLKSYAKYFAFDRRDVSSVAGFVLNKIENFMPLDPKILLGDPIFRTKVLKESPSAISGMALVFDDFSQMPGNITVPTQIIWGADDDVAPPRTGYVLEALITNSVLHLIPQTGHVPINKTPEEFHRLLMEGIQQTNTDLAIQKTKQNVQQTANCNHQKNARFSGVIDKLTINNCKNVLIEDAQIKQLSITDSRAFLRNVDIDSADTALLLKRSTVEITAGSIIGNIAIEAHESRLDIAGTRLEGKQTLITAPMASTAVFSLAPKLSGGHQVEMLHGRVNITPEQPLL